MQLIFINKLPKNSGIYLQFSMRQDREGYLRLIFSIGSYQYKYGGNIESVNHSPTLEFAFRLINGVVRVREFAYYEYGY